MKVTIVMVAILALVAVVVGAATIQAGAAAGSITSTAIAPTVTDDSAALIESALSDFTLNGATSDNVYQQQVVALWGIKDLVEVGDRQNILLLRSQAQLLSSQADLQRGQTQTTIYLRGIVILLVVIMAALAVIGVARIRPRSRPTSTTEPVVADSAS